MRSRDRHAHTPASAPAHPRLLTTHTLARTPCSYKKHQTVKHVTGTIGNTYIVFVTNAYCGSCTDSAVLRKEEMADRLPKDARYTVVLVYDRGVTQVDEFFAKGVGVATPDRAHAHQVVFGCESAEKTRGVGTERNPIEMCNR